MDRRSVFASDKVEMHFNFNFSAVQILWTLTFAAILVLLVVLLGRDRARRFPWFTTSVVIIGLRLLASRLLFDRLAPIPMNTIFLSLALIAGLVNVVVLVELALHAFAGASRRAWMITTLVLLGASGIVLAFWGPWPAWKTLALDSALAWLRLVQFITQKLDLMVDTLSIGLGIVVIAFGRRYAAPFRSHTQQIVIGLSTTALAQTAARAIWQAIAMHAAPTTQAEYERVVGMQEKLYNASSAIFVLVLVWWIVCLWRNEGEERDKGTEGTTEAVYEATS
jgi:hypothetical protein